MTWQDIPGWFDYADLYDLAVSRATDGGTLVEVGCWLGRSTAYLAEEVMRSGKRLQVVAVDNFVGPMTGSDDYTETLQRHGGKILDQFKRNMDACGVGDIIRIVEGDSAESAERFADESLDMVFIDADHSFDAVFLDILAWHPKVRPGGILAGHDIAQEQVRRAVESLIPYRKFGSCWMAA